VKLGKGGIKQVLELKLNESELELMKESAEHVRAVIDVYKKM
jgi:malate dehydrogenase